MLHILTLKYGQKYNSTYVNRLYNGVRKNTTFPFTFHCFTENADQLNTNIVVHDLPYKNIGENYSGWWYKPYLFAPHDNINGRILYLDLDTVIVDNIDSIIACSQDFIVLRDFMSLGNNVGSAIMMWNAGQLTHLWYDFINNNPAQIAFSYHPHGDQKWIQDKQIQRQYWQDLFPDNIVSYKVHCKSNVPENAKIICFHGRPYMHEVAQRNDHWLNKYWL